MSLRLDQLEIGNKYRVNLIVDAYTGDEALARKSGVTRLNRVERVDAEIEGQRNRLIFVFFKVGHGFLRLFQSDDNVIKDEKTFSTFEVQKIVTKQLVDSDQKFIDLDDLIQGKKYRLKRIFNAYTGGDETIINGLNAEEGIFSVKFVQGNTMLYSFDLGSRLGQKQFFKDFDGVVKDVETNSSFQIEEIDKPMMYGAKRKRKTRSKKKRRKSYIKTKKSKK
jgi:hypothetical protein